MRRRELTQSGGTLPRQLQVRAAAPRRGGAARCDAHRRRPRALRRREVIALQGFVSGAVPSAGGLSDEAVGVPSSPDTALSSSGPAGFFSHWLSVTHLAAAPHVGSA